MEVRQFVGKDRGAGAKEDVLTNRSGVMAWCQTENLKGHGGWALYTEFKAREQIDQP